MSSTTGEHKVIFYLYDCYVLGHYRSTKYNYQKMFFYIWHIYFNGKFASDCPVWHLWKRPKKLFSFSRYSYFFSFSSSFPLSKFKRTNVSGIIYDVMNWHSFQGVIFGITQKPLCIAQSNLVRWCVTNKEIFVNLFRNLKSDRPLVPGPFCFWWLCSLKGTAFKRCFGLFIKIKKESGTSFWCTFSAWCFH